MYRSQLLPYLTALFSGGNPSGSDFAKLIQGLGSEEERPHIICVSEGGFIPDNQLLTSTYPLPLIGGDVNSAVGSSVSGCGCGCSMLPTPGGSGVSSTSKQERVINILCDYFRNGWLLDVKGACTGSPCAVAYYVVLGYDSSANVYDICSVQFCNPRFDSNGFDSARCVRIFRMSYNRATGCVVDSSARLLLTDVTPVVQSTDIRGIKVIYSAPPKVEDGILYIQLKLSPLSAPIVEVDGVSQERISLSWGSVADAVGYEVTIDNGTTRIPVDGLSYAFAGLSPKTKYTIGVRAVGDYKKHASSSWSYTVVETKGSTILQTPAPTVVSTSASAGVTIRWSAVPYATSYSYRVGCGCGCGELITGVTDTSIVLRGLAPNEQYTCSVKAVSTEESVLDSDWAVVGFTTHM